MNKKGQLNLINDDEKKNRKKTKIIFKKLVEKRLDKILELIQKPNFYYLTYNYNNIQRPNDFDNSITSLKIHSEIVK